MKNKESEDNSHNKQQSFEHNLPHYIRYICAMLQTVVRKLYLTEKLARLDPIYTMTATTTSTHAVFLQEYTLLERAC